MGGGCWGLDDEGHVCARSCRHICIHVVCICHIEDLIVFTGFSVCVCVCVWVGDGWFKQPRLAQSVWTLGLGEAADLLHVE